MNVFSCAYLLSIYFLVKCLLKSFWVYLLSIIEFWEFSICSKYRTFSRSMICQYFLPVCGISFHCFNTVFLRADILHFGEYSCSRFLLISVSMVYVYLSFFKTYLCLCTYSGCLVGRIKMVFFKWNRSVFVLNHLHVMWILTWSCLNLLLCDLISICSIYSLLHLLSFLDKLKFFMVLFYLLH